MTRPPGAVMHEDTWYRFDESGEKEFEDYDEEEDGEKDDDEEEDEDSPATPEDEVEQPL